MKSFWRNSEKPIDAKVEVKDLSFAYPNAEPVPLRPFRHRHVSRNMKFNAPLTLFGLSSVLVLIGCASHGPIISGEFGSVKPPNSSQVAVLKLRSGETLVARKLQEEDDTLYVHLLDFSISPVPIDSVSGIEIRGRGEAEKVDLKGEALSNEEKAALTEAGARGAIWLALVLPVILLSWFASRFVDGLEG